MPVITRALLRKRSEHNEGIISTMEEISLHQEELESINEVLGATCRRLKILYLQNNIIPRMENLVHLKELEYLNMALNNVKKIEGLQNCEFLRKLDLTANFVDVDELEASINHLSERESIRELYMMGNPAQANWPGFESYVIAKIPQLAYLDGTEITRSMQISARQKLPALEAELRVLSEGKRSELAAARALAAATAAVVEQTPETSDPSTDAAVVCADVESDEEKEESSREELTENTPEARIEIYRELAAQKKEKEDRDKANKPRERDYAAEQATAVAQLREKEAEQSASEIKQKNEGGWSFRWDEESQPGFVLLEVGVARFLDSSLIDVDVHPSYISIIIKSKMLRLRNPAEVKAGECKCQRSKTTGSLLVIMPKVNPRENAITIRGDIKSKEKTKAVTSQSTIRPSAPASSSVKKKLTLQEQMMAAAAEAAAAPGASKPSESLPTQPTASMGVSIRGIVPQKRVEEAPKVDLEISTPSMQTSAAPPITVLSEEWAGLD